MKVLLIEDNPEIVNGVTLTFRLRWPVSEVISAGNGDRGVELVRDESPDIVILDINLPDIDGFDVLQQVRQFSNVPIIILSVRADEIDQLRGLEMGADDYIVKPFSPANLLTRVKAVLRRSGMRNGPADADLPPLAVGRYTLNFATQEVFQDSERVHLTATECKVLFCLARNEGQILTHETIENEVWGEEAKYIDSGTLKRYIHQLRTKLGDSADPPGLIFSERGRGYGIIKPK